MKTLTVKEAVARINEGGDLKGIILDQDSTQQVNIQDAIVLSSGGIVIPEQNIYYNDDDIAYDEDIDELTINSEIVELSWEEKARRAAAFQPSAIHIDLSTQSPEIDHWLSENKAQVAALLKPIVVHLFEAAQELKKGQE